MTRPMSWDEALRALMLSGDRTSWTDAVDVLVPRKRDKTRCRRATDIDAVRVNKKRQCIYVHYADGTQTTWWYRDLKYSRGR